jgi:hypothetical protein
LPDADADLDAVEFGYVLRHLAERFLKRFRQGLTRRTLRSVCGYLDLS